MNSDAGLVVDASVAVKWHLRDEELVGEASALLQRFIDGAVRLSAPAFIRYEIAQTLERACRGRRISEAEARTELQTFMNLGIHTSEDSDALVGLAQRIARRTGASVYDALYVAHAQALGFDLVTQDERLTRRMASYPVQVYKLVDLGDLS